MQVQNQANNSDKRFLDELAKLFRETLQATALRSY